MNKEMSQANNKPVRAFPPRAGAPDRRAATTLIVDPEAKKVFDRGYDSCTIDLPFNAAWSNGAGLYDYAVYGDSAPVIPIGQMARSATPSGRKLIIIGTRLGNVVVFERHVVNKKQTTISYTVQATSNVMQGGWFSNGIMLDDYEMALAVGEQDGFNIGRRIDSLWTSMKKT